MKASALCAAWHDRFAGDKSSGGHTAPAQRLLRIHSHAGVLRQPQPTRGLWFGSCGVLSLDPTARCRTRRVNRKGRSQTSEVRNQKLKKEETSEKSKWKIKDGRWNSRSPGDTEPDKAAGVNGEVVAAKRRATVFGVAVPAAAAQQSIAPTPRPLRIRQRVRGATEPAK